MLKRLGTNDTLIGDCRNLKAAEESVISKLPEELLFRIFLKFNLFWLVNTCSFVCKKWHRLASDPILLKKIVYRDWVFGSLKWARHCGNSFTAGEDLSEEYDSLPLSIGKMLTGPCPIYEGLRILDTHQLIRIPKTIYNKPVSLLSLRNFVTEYFPGEQYGLRSLKFITDPDNDMPIKNSYWIWITNEILPESNGKNFDAQRGIIKDLSSSTKVLYDTPALIEMLFFVCVRGFCPEKFIPNFDLPWRHARCNPNEHNQFPVVALRISYETGLGLRLDCDPGAYNKVGVVALRRFMELPS